jgi:chromosome partitioning protein
VGRVIAIANQKGGVGKTTTSINLAASLVTLDRNVLLVDLDPQGNATMGSGIAKNSIPQTITNVLLDEVDIHQVLCSCQAGYDLIPANRDLTAAEIGLLDKTRRESRLLQALARVKDSYDYILIDCPPALNMLTLNAFVVADGVLIPMQCEYYALEGLFGLLETIEQIRRTINQKIVVEGLVLTMYDGRNRLTMEVTNQLQEHFPDKVLTTVIPRNVRLAEAPSHGVPALIYDKNSVGASAYIELAKEILARRQHAEQQAATEAATV